MFILVLNLTLTLPEELEEGEIDDVVDAANDTASDEERTKLQVEIQARWVMQVPILSSTTKQGSFRRRMRLNCGTWRTTYKRMPSDCRSK